MIEARAPMLVVEDSDEDYEVTVRVLRELGVRNPFERVRDGVEIDAFLARRDAYANAGRPALMLLDLNLPGADGRALLARVRADPVLRGVPVVVISTSTNPADVTAAYAAGANGYLVKPVDIARFRDTMRRFVDYWFDAVQLDP